MPIDYNEFRKHKAEKRIEIVKLRGGYAVSKRQFSRDTGEEIEPEEETLDRAIVQERRDQLVKQLAEVDALLEHLNELDAKAKKKPAVGS